MEGSNGTMRTTFSFYNFPVVVRSSPCGPRVMRASSHGTHGTPFIVLTSDAVRIMPVTVETQSGWGMGDHGEVVEWLEPVCVCANVLCWLSLPSAPLLIKGTPQLGEVGPLKPTTQPEPLARARARPHSKARRSPSPSIRNQSKDYANQSIRSARAEIVKSKHFTQIRTGTNLDCTNGHQTARKSHGYPTGQKVPSLTRRDLRVASGGRGLEPLPIPGSLNFAFTAAGLAAALSMMLQQGVCHPAGAWHLNRRSAPVKRGR